MGEVTPVVGENVELYCPRPINDLRLKLTHEATASLTVRAKRRGLRLWSGERSQRCSDAIPLVGTGGPYANRCVDFRTTRLAGNSTDSAGRPADAAITFSTSRAAARFKSWRTVVRAGVVRAAISTSP